MLIKKLGKLAIGLVIAAYSTAVPATLFGSRDISNAIAMEPQEHSVTALMEKGALAGVIPSEKLFAITEIEPTITEALEADPISERVQRYADINMSETERCELAKIVYLESANQCAAGQQAVVEVILNRVISPDFPDTIHEVLHEGEGTPVPQFSTIGNLAMAEPVAAQYAAIDAALHGSSILPEDVVFFSRYGENDRVWGKIQDHVFCYAYIWE